MFSGALSVTLILFYVESVAFSCLTTDRSSVPLTGGINAV